MKQFHIKTLDGSGSFNFFTTAKDNKAALQRLLTKSIDFKRLVKKDKNLTIEVKCL